MAEFFGFEINRKGGKEANQSFFCTQYRRRWRWRYSQRWPLWRVLDLDGDKAKNEVDLILKYRDIAAQPECDAAIEDIVNEAIVGDNR